MFWGPVEPLFCVCREMNQLTQIQLNRQQWDLLQQLMCYKLAHLNLSELSRCDLFSFIRSCSASDIELHACAQRFLHVTLMRPMLLMIGIAIACRKSIAIMIEVMIAFMINYNCDQRHGRHKVDTFLLEMKMSVVNQALVAMCGFNATPIPIVCIHVYM